MIRTKLPTKLKDFPRAFSYLMHQTCKRRAALASCRLLPHHPPSTQSPSCSKTSATPTHLPDVLTVMRHPVPELPWPEQSPPWKFTHAGEQPLSASDVPASIYLLLKIWPFLSTHIKVSISTQGISTPVLQSLYYLVTTRKHINIREGN